MRILALLATCALTCAAPANLAAQSAPPPAYGPAISAAMADQVMAAAEREARANGWVVTIAIVDPNGDLMEFSRMDGAVRLTAQVAVLKAQTSATFRAPSKNLEDMANAGQQFWQSIPDVIPREGGVPIIHDGLLIGAIGVSGVQSSQDAQIARAGAAAVEGE